MQENKNWNSALDLIYLSACALHGKDPDETILADMDMPNVYRIAKHHRLQAISCMALGDLSCIEDDETKKQWFIDRQVSIRRIMNFALEREKLIRFLEKEKIKYLLLKGIILQNCYPKAGMRQMADNDILIDQKGRYKVKKFLQKAGYSVEMFGRNSPDTYRNKNGVEFEIHMYLALRTVNERTYYYYLDVWERLKKDEKNNFGYHFTLEDFYIYQTVHAHRHLTYSGGVGIRTLTDIYVYMQSYRDVLDWQYIYTELDKLGIREFEELSRTFAEKVYSPECINFRAFPEMLDCEECELLDIFIDSGAYGNAENSIRDRLLDITNENKKISFGTKLKYCFRRLFPPISFFTENIPFLNKYKILIPFYALFRIVRMPFTSLGRIIKELTVVKKQ